MCDPYIRELNTEIGHYNLFNKQLNDIKSGTNHRFDFTLYFAKQQFIK